MKNLEMIDAVQALDKLSKLKMPVKTALKVRSMMRSLRDLSDDVDAERMKLIQEYALKNENGEPVVVGQQYEMGDNRKSFDVAFGALMDCQISGLPAALKVNELENLEIEPITLYQLGELLEDSAD